MSILLTVALFLVASQADPILTARVPKSGSALKERIPFRSSGKIINGQEATRGQFPYQVAIYMDDAWFCGGSIISSEWILTAGHCGYQVTSFVVYMGTHNLDLEENSRVVMTTTAGFVYEHYRPCCTNDVALVKLPEPVAFSEFIQPIALVPREQVDNTFEGQAVRVSGWGITADDAQAVSPTLNFVDLTVISNAECGNVYAGVDKNDLCAAGVDNKSICSGDSGGPLVIGLGGTDSTQIGVVSFSAADGCELGYPSGFARLVNFIDWIQTTTGIVLP